MRTNSCNVTEVASIRTNMEKFEKNHEDIFGPPPKKFCDVCDKRLSFCECAKENEEKGEAI